MNDDGGLGLLDVVAVLCLYAPLLAGMWRVFEKAGKPGWFVLVPVYNLVTLARISGCSGWWVLWMIVPAVNIVLLVVLHVRLARRFGRGVPFGLGLTFIGPIFYPVLGFGGASFTASASHP